MSQEMEDHGNLELVTKYDLNQLDKRLGESLHEIREQLNRNSQSIVRLEAVYNSLEGLPNTITNLDKTITAIGYNLKSMDRNLADVKVSVSKQGEAIERLENENKTQNEAIHQQDEDIQRVDNKSKIDWAVFLTNNFWKVLGIGGVLYAVVRIILDKA